LFYVKVFWVAADRLRGVPEAHSNVSRRENVE